MSLSRYKACLVGAVIGDCMGSYFEGLSLVSTQNVLEHARRVEKNRLLQREDGSRPAGDFCLRFTDDTAMTRSVAASLLERKGFEAQDMAKRFSSEYFKDPNRGYGGNVITVFEGLRNPNLEDVYQPALEQFDGNGSYGNGGAMRIAPVPLFALSHANSKLQELVSNVTKLTHTHPEGVNGALLLAFAIDAVLRLGKPEDLKLDSFIDSLVGRMRPIEEKDLLNPAPPPVKKSKKKVDAEDAPYCAQLERIKEFVQKEDLKTSQIVEELGHDVSALGSVPTAILSFLRVINTNIPQMEDRSKFEQAILYAISLGGDTDTIASMSGALAGALWGMEGVPEPWLYYCEGVDQAEEDAEALYNLRDR